jgi:hypothetical protein
MSTITKTAKSPQETKPKDELAHALCHICYPDTKAEKLVSVCGYDLTGHDEVPPDYEYCCIVCSELLDGHFIIEHGKLVDK